MKVLIIINNLQLHGAQVLLSKIVMGLIHRIDFTVFLLSNEAGEIEVTLPKNVRIIRGSGKYNPITSLQLLNCVKKEQPNIIHAQLFPSIVYGSLVRLFFRSKRAYLTLHSTSTGLDKNRILQFLERLLFMSYDKIIAVSPEIKSIYSNKIQSQKDKIVVINNGVFVPKQIVKNLPKHNTISILKIARFEDSKNHVCLIEALAQLKHPFELDLLGNGKNLQKIKNLVESLDMTDKVNFLGTKPNVQDYIKQADIGILSSNWEGFGLSILEQMAFGVPCIASNVPGMADIIKGGALLFKAGSSEDLKSKIESLLDPELYESMSRSGYQKAKEYSLATTIRNYEEIYKEKGCCNL